jgi:hypothetical protein
MSRIKPIIVIVTEGDEPSTCKLNSDVSREARSAPSCSCNVYMMIGCVFETVPDELFVRPRTFRLRSVINNHELNGLGGLLCNGFQTYAKQLGSIPGGNHN